MAIPQQAYDIAKTLFTRPPGHFGKIDPGSAIGAYRQDPQSITSDVGMMGLVNPVKPGIGYVAGLGKTGLRTSLPKETFARFDIARDILKDKKTSSRARQYAIKIMDDLADYTVPRQVIDKFKGSPIKLANWIAKNIKETI